MKWLPLIDIVLNSWHAIDINFSYFHVFSSSYVDGEHKQGAKWQWDAIES